MRSKCNAINWYLFDLDRIDWNAIEWIHWCNATCVFTNKIYINFFFNRIEHPNNTHEPLNIGKNNAFWMRRKFYINNSLIRKNPQFKLCSFFSFICCVSFETKNTPDVFNVRSNVCNVFHLKCIWIVYSSQRSVTFVWIHFVDGSSSKAKS